VLHRGPLLALASSLALVAAPLANAAVFTPYTEHSPMNFNGAGPKDSLANAQTAIDRDQYVRADAWLEHAEVDLLNARALQFAREGKKATPSTFTITPEIRQLGRAQQDLLGSRPALAEAALRGATAAIG
jgi:hypothetical protein